jgi:hypothetical protein
VRPASRKTICLGIDCATINPAAQDMVFYSARHLLEQFKRVMSERFKSYEEFGKLLRTSQNPSILATSAVD